jgi:Holliday junction resolvasome RuvABC endonuclease subunit
MTGNGKAEKIDVEYAVRELLDLDASYIFISDDASDACGVILTYLIEKGLIDGR